MKTSITYERVLSLVAMLLLVALPAMAFAAPELTAMADKTSVTAGEAGGSTQHSQCDKSLFHFAFPFTLIGPLKSRTAVQVIQATRMSERYLLMEINVINLSFILKKTSKSVSKTQKMLFLNHTRTPVSCFCLIHCKR